jgi:hypothetical protein
MVAAQMLLAAVFGTRDSQSTPATNLVCEGLLAPLFNDAVAAYIEYSVAETGDP